MAFNFRIRKYDDIVGLSDQLRAIKLEVEARLEALEIEPTNFEEEIICRYVACRSTVKVAEFAKAKGIRSPKGTVFAGGDVSAIIKSGKNCSNQKLLQMAREIFDKNTEAVIRAYG